MTEYALEINGLKKVYDNDVEALKGIDLKITKGDFFALLGPNGAGKSSTIGIISSITNKTDGIIKIFGIDIDQDFPKAKSFLGVVAQEINFSQFEKVEDIVITQAGFYGIPKDIAKERCKNLLKKLSLWDKRHDQARSLSGGQKRRVMIAKALVHEPKLLILDEPTAGVDIELRREMWDFLSDINKKGTTIILTTHYLEEAEQHCNNIAIIDDGSIVEDTSMKELLSRLSIQSFVLDLENEIQELPNLPIFDLKSQDSKTLTATLTKDDDLNSLFAGPMYRQAMKELKIKTECRFKNRGPSHIIGIESRGFVMGAVLAYAMKLPFVMVRKAGAKYPGELLEESYTLEYGEATLTLQTGLLGHTDRCIVVDDLIATGGSVLATKRLIEQTGASVLGVSTVIDLEYVRKEPLHLDIAYLERIK